MMKFNYMAVLSALLILNACSSSNNSTPADNTLSIQGLADCSSAASNQSVICGTALASDGVTPLSGAEIKLVTNASLKANSKGVADTSKCVSDSNGEFACLLPVGLDGSQKFLISFNGFDQMAFTATLTLGNTTDAGVQTLLANGSEKWVVVPGFYDGVQVLLAQLKGCTLNNDIGLPFNSVTDDHTRARASTDCTNKGLIVLDENDLSSAFYPPTFLASQTLHEYDALFINCDADFSDFTGTDGPVNTNIKQFANNGKSVYLSDLSSYWLEDLYPTKVTFLGNNTGTGIIQGNVLHAGLAGVVSSTINLVFDLSVWSAIDTVPADVTTFIESDISSITAYTGTHPITIGWKQTASSGCVFYTSYHIEGASSGAPQELAMKYLIQNLNTVCI